MKYKVIITGPVGSGKSTAVSSITGDDNLLTDAAVSESDQVTRQRKQTTTVAMDYGIVPMRNGDVIHLYGTPGQERFDFMWDVLAQGTQGMVLLLDNHRNNPFRDLKYYTNAFHKLINSSSFIIGITRTDVNNDPPPSVYRRWLKELKIDGRVIPVDAREKNDVKLLLEHLIYPELHPDPAIEEDKPSPTIVNTSSESTDQEKDTSVVDEVATTAQSYAAEETFHLDEKSLEQIGQLKGVNGVSLSNAFGELLHSTIDDDNVNEFIAFLSGIAPSLESSAELGRIHRIMLRSPSDDNLTVFVEKERALGVSSEHKVSIPVLSQQVEDMLQWG
jgi:signal recognition particle receptor subunit beta